MGLLALFAFTTQVYANTHANSVPAAQGYDVVSYQTGKRPIKGNGHFTAHHEGAVYIFANQANLQSFNSDPEKYAPAHSGFCAYGVSVGKKFIGDPEVWRVTDGTLYINLDANIQDEWF
ncbi:MAG: YHS domain-containing (seleno)protein [Gammaproteobacteria bacterium]|nr:YHS domain-containing (seleno)protein [Gammaproteobacteria bacterium]